MKGAQYRTQRKKRKKWRKGRKTCVQKLIN